MAISDNMKALEIEPTHILIKALNVNTISIGMYVNIYKVRHMVLPCTKELQDINSTNEQYVNEEALKSILAVATSNLKGNQ